MRCLNCRRDGISPNVQVCPHCGVNLPALMRDLLPQGSLLDGGKYQIDYALGQGGFGITYQAVDLNLERPVAIKEFYPQTYVQRDHLSGGVSVAYAEAETYQRWLGRFEREGRILARLNHPGIVRVYALFKEKATAYLVMELLQGKTLRDELDAQPDKKLAPERVATLATQMVSALDTVHREGVYHLDLKPDNVMLTSDGRTVLVDFGAARQDLGQEQKHKSSTRAMTPRYAPLELLNSQPVGPESDLFELGMILCEALTGKCPPAILDRLGQEQWQPANVAEPWLSLLTQALRLQRENRPPSVVQWWQGYSPSAPVLPELAVSAIPQPAMPQPPVVETPLSAAVVSTPPVPESPPEVTPLATPEGRATQVEPAKLEKETEVAAREATTPQERQGETQPQVPTHSPSDRSLTRRVLLFLGLMGTGLGAAVMGRLVSQSSSPETSVVQPLSPAPFSTPATFNFETVMVNDVGQIIQRQQKTARYFTEELGNSLLLEMVEIPAGEFIMGSPESEAGRESNEGPQHRVSVRRFFMGRFTVIQAQWQQIMGNTPAHFKGENRPVEQVSWNNAHTFCKKLSQQTGRTYRLPSEAEWEYACRAGTTTPFYFGPTITPELVNYIGDYAYGSGSKGKYRRETTPVGSFPANGFGLYDMHGNVWEWCEDVWHQSYVDAPTDGSAWVSSGDLTYLLRGGSWDTHPRFCRSAFRDNDIPGYHVSLIGFRVVCEAPGL
jgi:eukaryotic-like serine/threonine-protein kinase